MGAFGVGRAEAGQSRYSLLAALVAHELEAGLQNADCLELAEVVLEV
jgi:hypothetical protein